MKKVMTIAALSLVSALYAAQPAGTNEDAMKARQEQMLKYIQAELGLTDKQTKKWGEIQEHYMKEHMKLRSEQNAEINAMLTKEQQKKFEQMQQRFRERLNARMNAEK